MYIACGVYTWMQICQRRGTALAASLDAVLTGVASAGCDGWEPFLETPEQVQAELAACDRAGLAVRTAYANIRLHDESAPAAVDALVALAAQAQPAGLAIVVVNPEPVRWGGPEVKSDAQLIRQAQQLDALGHRLGAQGQRLAYHTHDAEMRCGARELHHMLLATDPAAVGFCLDAHWIFRGCGDSELAVRDIVRLYGPRIISAHLRQSRGGLWSAGFGPGDLDYAALLAPLDTAGMPLVIEQAHEAGTPEADPVESLAAGVDHVRRVVA